MSLATRFRQVAQPAAPGGFNPETDIAWRLFYWAEGTRFTGLGLSNGDPVLSWPDEKNEADASTKVGPLTPQYVASQAELGGRPTVRFNDCGLQTGVLAPVPSYPLSFVGVFKVDYGNAAMCSGIAAGAENRVYQAGSSYYLFAGSYPFGGTTTTGGHFRDSLFVGTTSPDRSDLDGVNIINGNAGTQAVTGLSLGNNHAGTQGGSIRFGYFGWYEGDIQTDANWSALKTWTADHYGLTIS